MSAPSRSGDYPFAEAQRALERLRFVRKAGVPFDPAALVAKLRDAVEDGSAARMSRWARELEAVLSSVELSWNELERQRVVLEKLHAGVVGVFGENSRPAELAAYYLESLQDPFSEPSTLLAQVRLGREIEARLREELRLASQGSRPRAGASGPAPRGPDRRRRARPIPSPALAWIASPAGLTFLAITAIVLVGAFERLVRLGSLSLWNDEAQSTLISFSILQNGYPVITSQHVINNYEPLYPYLEAASVRLLGHTNFAFRLPSALVGIAAIPVGYYVGARLRDRYVGIALAAMVGFSTEYIAWSRQARWYMLLVLLFALGTLLAIAWARTPVRGRRWWFVGGALGVGVLAGFTSIGLFLLYIPAIVVAGMVYLVASRWADVRRWFGLPGRPGDPRPRAGVSYRWRTVAAVVVPTVFAVAVVVERARISDAVVSLVSRGVGFAPYPLVWSSNFGVYLVQYYLGVLVLDLLGVAAIARRGEPLELALLAFCAAGFVGVSSLASLTNDIAGGNTSFERHLVPLLFFLFLVAAIGLVETLRYFRAELPRLWQNRPHAGGARPLAFAFVVALLLIVPSAVVPSGQTVHQHTSQFPTGGLVTWVPFSADPAQPSAIYQSDQANFQLAAEYVAAHRNATDVIGSTNPGAPSVYLGPIQYWVRGDPDNSTIIEVNGAPAFFQTGSPLVNSTPQLLNILFNTSGWLISDVPSGTGSPFPGGMDLVLAELMKRVPTASDATITLYSWNTTTRPEILRAIERATPSLDHFEFNITLLTDWGATAGVTTSPQRDLLLPIEGYLVRHVTNDTLPLATLLNVYNNRPDLQLRFPWVLNTTKNVPPANDSPLIDWAYEVCTGAVHDGSRPTLLPFAAWYRTNG